MLKMAKLYADSALSHAENSLQSAELHHCTNKPTTIKLTTCKKCQILKEIETFKKEFEEDTKP